MLKSIIHVDLYGNSFILSAQMAVLEYQPRVTPEFADDFHIRLLDLVQRSAGSTAEGANYTKEIPVSDQSRFLKKVAAIIAKEGPIAQVGDHHLSTSLTITSSPSDAMQKHRSMGRGFYVSSTVFLLTFIPCHKTPMCRYSQHLIRRSLW